MFFLCLALFALVSWFGPWWTLALAAAGLGAATRMPTARAFGPSLAAALVWMALAYMQDARLTGLVSRRLGGLLHLPSPPLLFLVMGVLAFVTTFLCLNVGSSVHRALRPPAAD